MSQTLENSPTVYVTDAMSQLTTAGALVEDPSSPDMWNYNVSLLGLTLGATYDLCIDPDGGSVDPTTSLSQSVATTFLSFKIGGLDVSTEEGAKQLVINNVAHAEIRVDCIGCFYGPARGYLLAGTTSSCASDDFLSGNISSMGNSTATQVFHGKTTQYTLTIDASGTTLGQSYTICIDFDGIKKGLSFLKAPKMVNISPMRFLINKYVGNWEPLLKFSVVSGFDVAIYPGATAYIGETCDSSIVNGVKSASSSSPRSTESCQLVYDSNGDFWYCTVPQVFGLSVFALHKICIDIDGTDTAFGFLEQPHEISYSAISGVMLIPSTEAVTISSSAEITLACGATTCVDNVMMGQLVLDPGLDYSDLSCAYNIFNGANVSAAGIYSSAPATGTQENTAQIFPLVGTTASIRFYFDTSALLGGGRYKLCLDRDGEGEDYPYVESGKTVYVNPVTELLTLGIFMQTLQYVSFVCPTCVDQKTLAYISVTTISKDPGLHDEPCDFNNFIGTTVQKGNYHTSSFPIQAASMGSTTFSIGPIDASDLSFGQFYKLCIDLDGTETKLAVGYSGMKLFVSPINQALPRAVLKATNQQVQLYCTECNPEAELTETYLGTVCDSTKVGGAAQFEIPGVQTASAYMLDGDSSLANTKVAFAAENLIRGNSYSLCADIDGQRYLRAIGDTGFDMNLLIGIGVFP